MSDKWQACKNGEFYKTLLETSHLSVFVAHINQKKSSRLCVLALKKPTLLKINSRLSVFVAQTFVAKRCRKKTSRLCVFALKNQHYSKKLLFPAMSPERDVVCQKNQIELLNEWRNLDIQQRLLLKTQLSKKYKSGTFDCPIASIAYYGK